MLYIVLESGLRNAYTHSMCESTLPKVLQLFRAEAAFKPMYLVSTTVCNTSSFREAGKWQDWWWNCVYIVEILECFPKNWVQLGSSIGFHIGGDT